MASVKRTADQPEDLDVEGAVEAVAKKGSKAPVNSTFASRAKRIGSASNKAITAEESKAK